MNKLIIYIPFRRGSESIKDKNLSLIHQTTLFELNVLFCNELLLKYPKAIEVIYSTDYSLDEPIIRQGLNKAKFNYTWLKRPEKFTHSHVSLAETLYYDLGFINVSRQDIFTALYLTTPFKTPDSFLKALKYYKNNQNLYENLITVVPGLTALNHYFYVEQGFLNSIQSDLPLPKNKKLFKIVPAFFISKLSNLLSNKGYFYSKNQSHAWKLSEKEGFDIDSEFNLKVAQLLHNLT